MYEYRIVSLEVGEGVDHRDWVRLHITRTPLAHGSEPEATRQSDVGMDFWWDLESVNRILDLVEMDDVRAFAEAGGLEFRPAFRLMPDAAFDVLVFAAEIAARTAAQVPGAREHTRQILCLALGDRSLAHRAGRRA